MNQAADRNSIDTYFGKEVVNRVSFLREDAEFITNAVLHPSTRFVFFEAGNVLINKKGRETTERATERATEGATERATERATEGATERATEAPERSPERATEKETKLVVLANGNDQLHTIEGSSVAGTSKGLLDNCPEWASILTTWAADNKNQAPDSRAENKASFLFLGLKDESVGLDFHKLKSYNMETYLDHQGRYFGIPYFGVDLSNSPAVARLIKDVIASGRADVTAEEDLVFTSSREHTMTFTADEAALFSHGKMFFEWLGRNRFCPGCGSKVIGIHAGGKLKCTNEEKVPATDGDGDKYGCPVRNTRVSNVSFPRTDAVVITAIVNRQRTHMLLSLNKRYAFTKMYSCTAGFMEPSETVETATKREIWEETGVVCSDIQILMTQPWPFPGNLMIGCIATVDFNGVNENIHLGHDRELADARWFDLWFVAKLLKGKSDSALNPEGIKLPTDVSIAYTLIKHVVDKGETKL